MCEVYKKLYSLHHEPKKNKLFKAWLKQHLSKFYNEENKDVLKRQSEIDLEKQETK